MDKGVQFPPTPEVKDGRGTVTDVEEISSAVLNLTEVHDTFSPVDKPVHTSSICTPSLPSFNAMNEQLKKNLPSSNIKLPDLKRSKIVFEGKTCVREFITQVEEYFLYKNFDENVLVSSFSDLLSGSAAKWFRAVRIDIASWQQLKVALLKRFDKLEYDYFLEYDLRTRRQNPSESLPDFITELMDMASRLATPLNESVIITIIKHNMLSIYTPYVLGRQVSSLESFMDLGKELEIFVSRKSLKDSSKPFKIEKVQSNAIASDDTVCLKCKSSGHTYKNCSSIPGMICFKCKKLGVITKYCDVCNLEKKNSSESKN